MTRRRNRPSSLSELLPRLAREQGAESLADVALEAILRNELGEWLGRRLLGCQRRERSLELEIAGEAAAREVEAHAPELLGRLRGRLGRDAPGRLVVRVGRALPPSAPDAASMAASEAEEPLPPPGADLREALEGVEDSERRAQFARLAALWGRGRA